MIGNYRLAVYKEQSEFFLQCLPTSVAWHSDHDFPQKLKKSDTWDCLGESSKAYLTPDCCLQLRMKDWRLREESKEKIVPLSVCVCVGVFQPHSVILKLT